MKVRLGNRKDAKLVADWLKEMWLLHCDKEPQYVSRKKISAYPTRRITRYLKDCFNGKNKSYLLIAEEGKEIAGFLKIDVAKIESFYVQTRVLYLDDIYVREQYMGRGVSKLLYQEAEKIAKKRKIKWLKARFMSLTNRHRRWQSQLDCGHFILNILKYWTRSKNENSYLYRRYSNNACDGSWGE